MDTSLANNATLLLKIKREAIISGILEAFLESAPQFILQMTIILKTGNISEFFSFLVLKDPFLSLYWTAISIITFTFSSNVPIRRGSHQLLYASTVLCKMMFYKQVPNYRTHKESSWLQYSPLGFQRVQFGPTIFNFNPIFWSLRTSRVLWVTWLESLASTFSSFLTRLRTFTLNPSFTASWKTTTRKLTFMISNRRSFSSIVPINLLKWSRVICCTKSIVHTSLIHDYLTQSHLLEENLKDEMYQIFKQSIKSDGDVLNLRDPMFGWTSMHFAVDNALYRKEKTGKLNSLIFNF